MSLRCPEDSDNTAGPETARRRRPSPGPASSHLNGALKSPEECLGLEVRARCAPGAPCNQGEIESQSDFWFVRRVGSPSAGDSEVVVPDPRQVPFFTKTFPISYHRLRRRGQEEEMRWPASSMTSRPSGTPVAPAVSTATPTSGTGRCHADSCSAAPPD